MPAPLEAETVETIESLLRQDLKQEAICRRVGCSPRTVQRIVAGAYRPCQPKPERREFKPIEISVEEQAAISEAARTYPHDHERRDRRRLQAIADAARSTVFNVARFLGHPIPGPVPQLFSSSPANKH